MIPLNPPDKTRGLPYMQTLAQRASIREWSDKEIGLQNLSDLLWAANGVNRPENGRRTAPSATNAQDVEIYVFTSEGVHRYAAKEHALVPVLDGDHRVEIGLRNRDKSPAPIAPIELILVTDTDRFPFEDPSLRLSTGCIDIGIVSQNISGFCAATGLVTCPRAYIDQQGLTSLLGLRNGQHAILDHPIGFTKHTNG